MPKPPHRSEDDSVAAEVDALLKKLPGADPGLLGDPEPQARPGVPRGITGPVSGAGRGPTKRERVLLWLLVTLGVLLGVGVTQWPYLRYCGFPLYGFLAVLSLIVVTGIAGAVGGWRQRSAAAHVIALATVVWGLILWTGQLLPRVGYAKTAAAWACVGSALDFGALPAGGYAIRPDGSRLFYRMLGKSESTVIAPGAVYLTSLLRPLELQYRVALYDPRHRGASQPASDTTGLSMRDQVLDLDALRAHFGIEQFALVGWSDLAAVVANAASEFSERVTRVVMIDPLPPTRGRYRLDFARGAGEDRGGVELLRLLRERGEDRANPEDYCHRYWDIVVLTPRMGNADAKSNWSANPCQFANERPDRMEARDARLIAALGNWDWRATAARYPGPVLIIHGTADPVPIEGAHEWAASFPNARVIEIDGAGHFPWLEQPEAVFGAIRTFLGGAWPEQAAVERP